ncbi:hypothetical protein ABQE44_25685, partial [Mycolicibacterium sp. XJ2546]
VIAGAYWVIRQGSQKASTTVKYTLIDYEGRKLSLERVMASWKGSRVAAFDGAQTDDIRILTRVGFGKSANRTRTRTIVGNRGSGPFAM